MTSVKAWRAFACVVALCALATAPVALGQTGVVPRNLQFAHVTTDHGLSQQFVHAVAQDGNGFMWFATQEGLNRYDGHDIVVYQHDPGRAGTLADDFVWSLLVDRQGRLWVATNGGLQRYDPRSDKFESPYRSLLGPAGDASPRVRTLAMERSGALWVGTLDAGLFRIDAGGGSVRRWHERGGSSGGRFPSGPIMALLEDRKGRVWIGTDGGGIAHFDRTTDSFVRYPLVPAEKARADNAPAEGRIRAVHEGRDGRVWVGTATGGLYVFDDAVGGMRAVTTHTAEGESAIDGQVTAIYQDRDDTLWIGSERGLCEHRAAPNLFVCYRRDITDPSSLPNDRVNAIVEDRSGVLWVGSHGGVSRWNRVSELFTYYRAANGYLAADTVSSVVEGHDSGLWIGTYGGGLTHVHVSSGRVEHFRHAPGNPTSLADDRVMTLHVDRRGVVWVGTFAGGVSRLVDEHSGRFVHYRHDPQREDSLSGDAVTSIESDRNGGVWVGVFEGGLNHIRADGSVRRYRHDPRDPRSLPAHRVLDLYRDRRGTLWVGMEKGGLARYDAKLDGFVRLRGGAPEPLETAWEINESSDGSLWIGTQGQGAYRWPAADRAAGRVRFEQRAKTDGLASNTVFGILEGEPGEMWIASSKGLTLLDVKSGKARHFDQRTGLRSDEFNLGARWRSGSGRLYFGSTAGLVGFHPRQTRHNATVPLVGLVARSRERPLARAYGATSVPRIEVPYLDPFVEFEFAGLDYVSSDKNRYRYWLEGLEQTWVDARGFRRAVYTRLPPGDYVFHVQASNNDGLWNIRGASVAVHVAPPPWNTGLAYAGYAVIALVAGLLVIRNQRANARAEQHAKEELERQVVERTREVAERVGELEQLNVQLREASITDSLTGLRNRRHLDQAMAAELARVDRRAVERGQQLDPGAAADSSALLFFMMIDLDGFKVINDTHGHAAGDEALLQVRDILLDCVRQSDVVVRWGGDEFLVVGPTANFDGAKVLAERIRASLATQRFVVAGGNACRLSASIGLAPYPFRDGVPGFCGWEQVADVADQCAYLAKSHGRNAWVSVTGTATTRPVHLQDLDEHLQEFTAQGALHLDTSLPLDRLFPPAVEHSAADLAADLPQG